MWACRSVEFATPVCRRTGHLLQRRVIGFVINSQRLGELRQGIDRTNETSAEELEAAHYWNLQAHPAQLSMGRRLFDYGSYTD